MSQSSTTGATALSLAAHTRLDEVQCACEVDASGGCDLVKVDVLAAQLPSNRLSHPFRTVGGVDGGQVGRKRVRLWDRPLNWETVPIAASMRQRVRRGYRRVDDSLAAWEESRQDRLWERMKPDLANAALVGVGALLSGWWAQRYYGQVGLEPSDANVSLAVVVLATTLVSGLIVALMLLYAWVMASMVRSLFKVFAVTIGAAILTGAVGSRWSPVAGFGVFVACVVIAVFALRRRVHRRIRGGHWRRLVAGGVFSIWATVIAWTMWSLEPRSYREHYDRVPVSPVSLPQIFAPLPNDFVINSAGGRQQPMVLLSRDAWMTVIDPCQEPPYDKHLVRYDEVDLRPSSFAEAMAMCPRP